jgi:hypothetical protein
MKKFFGLLVVTAFFAGSLYLQSCKKCSTCTYVYSLYGYTQTYTFPEECGSSSDIDTYKAACQSVAATYGASCSCTSD